MLVICPHCQAQNRVPEERLAEAPGCGRCHAELLPDHPVALDDTNLKTVIEGTELPVVVDFWAEWCGPCQMMAPQFAQAAKLLRGKALLAKVDTDDNPRASVQNRIRGIPTMVLYRGGQEVKRVSGAMSASQIVQWVASA